MALTYVLSGLCGGAGGGDLRRPLGQAKADAGTGYELSAITAVVLGGTSIFGGRGSIVGTLLGLFAIAILQNGLRLADLPAGTGRRPHRRCCCCSAIGARLAADRARINAATAPATQRARNEVRRNST